MKDIHAPCRPFRWPDPAGSLRAFVGTTPLGTRGGGYHEVCYTNPLSYLYSKLYFYTVSIVCPLLGACCHCFKISRSHTPMSTWYDVIGWHPSFEN